MKYLVSRQGDQRGPFTIDEIVRLVRSRELDPLDYAFDDERRDWVLLTEIAGVAAALRATAKPAAPKNTSGWLILKGDAEFGPYSFDQMIELQQQKMLYSFDWCRPHAAELWARISDVAEFSIERVRLHFNGDSTTFIPRQNPRREFAAPVLVRAGENVWRAEARTLSIGGLGVRSRADAMIPGQTVFVHAASTHDLAAFTARCEVVAKAFVTPGSPIEYGLRFLELGAQARASIQSKVA